MTVEFTEGHIDFINDMLAKQDMEHKEQFATLMGRFEDGRLIVDDCELWSSKDLNQTEVSVTPISDSHWDKIGFNMNAKNCDFIITLHTHPEWFGTNRTGLDLSDQTAFKHWTRNFEDFGKICINGIVTRSDSILLTYYSREDDKFVDVSYEMRDFKRK